QYADVHVATQIANDGSDQPTVQVAYTITDPAGRVVARATAAGGATPTDLRVNHPHLWSTTDPALYALKTTVTTGAQPTADSATTTFGIRWLTFDPNTGITLNGKPLKLHGVDLHNDEGALGSVDNYDALWRQMSMLKAMGVNAFRTSHNPPSPEL